MAIFKKNDNENTQNPPAPTPSPQQQGGVFSRPLSGGRAAFAPSTQQPSAVHVATSAGKQYTLDKNAYDWITSRYKADQAGTYGNDDADQFARRTGQMSAKARSTYGDTDADRRLYQLGLPSEANLDKYVGAYNAWHTGGIDDIFGNDVPPEEWTKIGEMYKSDWQYENNAEDQARKTKGLMPKALEAKYQDNELDENLKLRGLPSASELSKYGDRYKNYAGIENFYIDAAGEWTNLRLNGIQNDNTLYDQEDGTRKTGKQLYAEAFYNALGRTGEDGQQMHSGIFGLFKNNHVVPLDEAKPDATGDTDKYITETGKLIAGAGKAKDAAEDYAKYNAFSFDDFASKYDDYYERYYSGLKLGDGQSVAERLAVANREADAVQTTQFYAADHKMSKDAGDTTSVQSFISRYQTDYPSATPEQMFSDMLSHGMDMKTVEQARDLLQGSAKTNKEFRDIGKAYTAARRDNIDNRAEFLDINTLNSGVADRLEKGGYTAENIAATFNHYLDAGVSKEMVKEAVGQARALYRLNYAPEETGRRNRSRGSAGYEATIQAFNDYEQTLADKDNRAQRADLRATVGASHKEAVSDENVTAATNSIRTGLEGLAGRVTPEQLIDIAKSVADQPGGSTAAVRTALLDLGFTMDGDFNSPEEANAWTANWSDLDKTTFRNALMSDLPVPTDTENKRVAWSTAGEGPAEWKTPGAEAIEKFKTDAGALSDNMIAYLETHGGDIGIMTGEVDELRQYYSGLGITDSQIARAENELMQKTDDGTLIKQDNGPVKGIDYTTLRRGDFAVAYNWAMQKVADGEMTEKEAFDVLSEEGYNPEIAEYAKEEQVEALFKEVTVPEMYKAVGGEKLAAYEALAPEERAQLAQNMWDDMKDEEKTELLNNFDWRHDPNVHKTTKEMLVQQGIGIVPRAFTAIAAGVMGFTDMVATSISGKPELWDATKDLMAVQNTVNSYGKVTDDVNGSKAIGVVADAATELTRMYMLGTLGSGLGQGAIGQALSKISDNPLASAGVKRITQFAMGQITASPFVVNAIGNNYAEAKLSGASNAGAVAYGTVTGSLEGILEGFNFDQLWGKVLGNGRFGKMLMDGGKAFKAGNVVWKARVANMVASALGEFTEESVSYVAETLWKTNTDWGTGTKWSAKDWFEQASMGFLTGFFGAVSSMGSINTESVLNDYFMNDPETLSTMLDATFSKEIFDKLPAAEQAAYRKGGAKTLSNSAYAQVLAQLKAAEIDSQNAYDTFNKAEAQAKSKLETVKTELNEVVAKASSLDLSNPKAVGEFATLCKKLGITIDLGASNTSALPEVYANASSMRNVPIALQVRRAIDAKIAAAQNVYDTTVANARAEMNTRLENGAAQALGLQAQLREHYAGIYLRNEAALRSRDTETANQNMANARQNGDDVTPESVTSQNAPVDGQQAEQYNNNANQEGATNGSQGTKETGAGSEAQAGGDAGVSGRSFSISDTSGQESRVLGRENPGWFESVPVTEKAREKGIEPVELRTDNNDPSSFHAAIGEAKTANPFGAFVTQHDVDEYAGMKTYMSADSGVGVAVTDDGNIVSVFKNPDRNQSKKASTSILFTALENGGKKLDNFNSADLSDIYLQHGFVPVARIKFNDEYAPDGWNYERDGRPDILFWVHNGDDANTILEKMGTYVMPDVESLPLFEGENAYDDAAAYRDSLVNENTGWAANQQAEVVQPTNTRTLTDEEVAKVKKAAKALKYGGDVVFIDDPNAEGAWIDDNGTITINRANITEAETKELANNPGWWLLKHELAHFTESTMEYGEYAGIVKRIMQRRLGENYTSVLNAIKNDYAQRGVTLDDAGVERELVAKFMGSGELLNNAESIDMFVREQGDIADRVYNWIRYKIQDLKLRRKPNSALARDMLKAERLYAQAYRKANRKPGRDNGVSGRQYSINSNNRSNNQLSPAQNNGTINEDKQARIARAREMLAEGATGSSIYNETGFAVLNNGDLSDLETLETIRIARQDNDTERENDALYAFGEEYGARPIQEYDLRGDRGEGEQVEGRRQAVKFWDDISNEQRNVVINAVSEHLQNNPSEEASLFFDGMTPEGVARFVYERFADTPLLLDAEASFIPNLGELKQRLDDIAPRNSRQYSTGQSWDDLIQQYGAIPQGRAPRANNDAVPAQVDNATRVSKLGRSLMESSHMDDGMRATAREMMLNQNWLSYIPKTNAETMADARAFIAARQPLEAQQDFHDMVMSGKFGTKTNAIGLQLLADASERGDVDSFYEIATDLQIAATEAGQSAQIFNVLKELKGVGSAYYMQRVVDRMNVKYDDLIQKGKMQRIVVSPALMNQLAQAKTIDQMAAAEEAVAKEIAAQLPLRWSDRLSSWRYFSMLANPVTHARNMFGNLLMKGMNAAKDAVATGIEAAGEGLGWLSQEDRAHAILNANDKATWRSFVDASYDEQAKNLRGGGKLGFETFIKQNMRSFDTKWLNAIAQFNFRALEGEDIAFIRPAYKTALTEYMKAQGFVLNDEGQAGRVNDKGEFVPMTNAESTAAVEWASQQAWKQTFRDASSLATMLNKLSKENAISKLLVEGVMPFKKTPINIAKRGLEYSPAGIIMGTVQLATKVKQGKMSAATAIDNLASGITGTALMALGVFLAKAGLIRAGGEKDKKLETYLQDTGDQTYSFKAFGRSINMSSIAPATIPLFMGVALQEMIDQSGDSLDLSTISEVLAGTLNPFMEMSFMSSLNSALQNYNNNGIGGALGNTLLTAAQNYGSQYLPTFMGKVAQFADPTRRTTKSDATSPIGSSSDYYLRSLAKKVPGLEATLQSDVDIWGRTDKKDTFGEWARDFANKFILPTNVKVSNRDAVDEELLRVVESTGITSFLPSDGNKSFTVKGETYKMNARQYAEFSQERGQAAYAAIKAAIQSPAYQQATDEGRAELLEKALKDAYKHVNNNWKEKLGALDAK